MRKILVVEDDRGIANLVAGALHKNGFTATIAQDGRSMDQALKKNRVDLMLLDLMLPGEDGLSIARRIRAEHAFPIIMLTAVGEETDRVVGLEIGADDYVVKPFSSRELIARIRAVLRRTDASPKRKVVSDVTYTFADWRLSVLKQELHDPDGVRIELTSAELQLLRILCEHPRQIMTREQLLQLTQDQIVVADDRSIDTLVSRIRRKIEADPKDPEFIKTVRLEGYMFTPEVVIS